MKIKFLLSVALLSLVFRLGQYLPQDQASTEAVFPSCNMCLATYVSSSEIQQYEKVAIAARITDQQVRSVDIGRSKVQIALAHRGALESKTGTVAEHDLVTEVYYVVSGSGTIRTSPELVDAVRRPLDNRAVMTLNGPGNNAADLLNEVVHELRAGDIFIIPAGTGHQFIYIEDHITYVMIRIDPDEVMPSMDEEDSRKYLASQGAE